ncbi:winged helix-turn-helix domain-containing protein [Vibrio cholerae]|uniref:winged helix-turn-helix domain-containing protein n=2 Tax=Vibrio cholerae TaxID=666 RepID=UPI000E0AA6A5|nr:helix-turn-helix domain-containing protein [Vibrio cholerae]
MNNENIYLDKEINLLLNENGTELRKLSEAEAKILAEFVENSGKCLTRDHLVAVGWPNSVVVENSLNMAIRKFRTLGINIETIPRKGYALIDTHILFGSKVEIRKLNPLLNIDDTSESSVGNLSSTSVVEQPFHNGSFEEVDMVVGDLPQISNEQMTEPPLTNNETISRQIKDDVVKNRVQQVSQQVDEEKKPTYLKNKLSRNFKLLTAIYLLFLMIFYFSLESAKPDIYCFSKNNVKVCTTYDLFDQSLMKELEPGSYLYGKTFNGSEQREFIKVKD